MSSDRQMGLWGGCPHCEGAICTPRANRGKVNDWSHTSFDVYFITEERAAATAARCHAERLIRRGASRHDILTALASAEVHAVETDRLEEIGRRGAVSRWAEMGRELRFAPYEPIGPEYAARLDAYVARDGLKGWYRYTDRFGKHRIAINYLRTAADGDRGRYFYYSSQPRWGHGIAIVDRDSGRTVTTAPDADVAREWIDRTEAASIPTPPPHTRPTNGAPASDGPADLAELAAELDRTAEHGQTLSTRAARLTAIAVSDLRLTPRLRDAIGDAAGACALAAEVVTTPPDALRVDLNV